MFIVIIIIRFFYYIIFTLFKMLIKISWRYCNQKLQSQKELKQIFDIAEPFSLLNPMKLSIVNNNFLSQTLFERESECISTNALHRVRRMVRSKRNIKPIIYLKRRSRIKT